MSLLWIESPDSHPQELPAHNPELVAYQRPGADRNHGSREVDAVGDIPDPVGRSGADPNVTFDRGLRDGRRGCRKAIREATRAGFFGVGYLLHRYEKQLTVQARAELPGPLESYRVK